MTATNKLYSYPRATAIRINVHPVGENPTNTYDPQPYVSHVVHV
jgi:hypothetical protein